MSVCPSDQDLETFVGQGASEQELSAWSVHLEACGTCAARPARKQIALSGAAGKDESEREPKADPNETVTVKPVGRPDLDAGADHRERRVCWSNDLCAADRAFRPDVE